MQARDAPDVAPLLQALGESKFMPTSKAIALFFTLTLSLCAHSQEKIVCKSGDFRFAFSPAPKSELGDIILALWMKGEEQKFSTGEITYTSEQGDIHAEFPPRIQQNQSMKGLITILSYNATLRSGTLIIKGFDRSTGEAIIGACKVVKRERP